MFHTSAECFLYLLLVEHHLLNQSYHIAVLVCTMLVPLSKNVAVLLSVWDSTCQLKQQPMY